MLFLGFYFLFFFFFFSSRRRHTRWTGDWSSDVCSSDLVKTFESLSDAELEVKLQKAADRFLSYRKTPFAERARLIERSEERRVGKSVDLGGRRISKKKKRKDNRGSKQDT